MTETFEQMALRIWEIECGKTRVCSTSKLTLMEITAIAFATAIRDELAKGAEPAAHLSEIWDGMIERRRSSPSVENRAAELEQERDELRQQLAASQAREQLANECRIALVHQIHELADHIERSEYCINDIDMLKQMRGQRAHAMSVASRWNQNGNPFSTDTSALEAMIAKAGEVMRERAISAASAINPIYGSGAAIDAISTVLIVTLDDLKDGYA